MTPFKEFTCWNIRSTDLEESIEPYKKYYFLCEGENTEKWYFEKLISEQKILNIHPLIDILFLEKTNEDAHVSNPKKLLEYANSLPDKLEDFDKTIDKIIIVFDADIYKTKSPEMLLALIKEMESNNHIVALTNPSFELFLLLHVKDSLNSVIFPNKYRILQNKKEGKHRFVYSLLSKTIKINSKTNKKIGDLCNFIDVAIEQEKQINRDIYKCQNKLTCNIGKIIEMIRNEKI